MVKYDGPIVTLVNNLLTLPMQNIGFVCFFWLYRNKKKAGFSKNMVTYIAISLLFCIFALPMTIYSLALWRDNKPVFNARILFWFGLPKLIMMSLYPSSFLFVSLERLIHVRFPTRVKNWKKAVNISAFIVRILMLIQAGVILTIMLTEYHTLHADDICYTYSCVMKSTSIVVYLMIRYPATALNIFFVIILLNFMRRQRMQYDSKHVSTVQHQINFSIQKQNTKIIMHAMLLDIFVDFLPHFAAFLIYIFTEPKIIDFGLPPMITSIQVGISGILYVRPWRKRFKRLITTHPS